MNQESLNTASAGGAVHLQLTQESEKHLLKAAKWGKLIAILGFIVNVFLILAGIVISLVLRTSDENSTSFGTIVKYVSPIILSTIYILVGIMGLIPAITLNSFSNSITLSVRNMDQKRMTRAIKRLGALFTIIGIYTLILIAFYIIFIIVIASAAMFAV